MDKLMTVRYKHTKKKNQITLRNDECKQDRFQIRFVNVNNFDGIIYIAKSLHRKTKTKTRRWQKRFYELFFWQNAKFGSKVCFNTNSFLMEHKIGCSAFFTTNCTANRFQMYRFSMNHNNFRLWAHTKSQQWLGSFFFFFLKFWANHTKIFQIC